jgi:hypothetical protein
MSLKKIQLETPEQTNPTGSVVPHENEPLTMDEVQDKKPVHPALYIFLMLVMVLGVISGFVLSRTGSSSSTGGSTINQEESSAIDGKKVIGVADKQTFKDSAEGVVEAGGLDGEGTHKLIRDGGPSQTVYLISSVVDLDQFIGKQVTVWGQTMGAKKAAWLMDVGKVEIQ